MAAETGWLDGEDHVRRVLRDAHKARHNAGRQETRRRTAELQRLREAGQHARAARLEELVWKKGVQFMRKKRQREELEAQAEMRKLGAALRRAERATFKRQPPAELFQQFEARDHPERRGPRDLYYDFIGRGLGSGKKRDYARHQRRSSSRTTPWKSGEMGRKVRYIFREDALEQVDGNAITNMGDDIVEAVACSRLLEDLERLGREKNGGVYHHVIVGLPHHLTGNERAELLNELTAPLRELKLPFCAALHKPDKRGDQRNFHAHILVSLRPMERVGEYQWEFSPSKRTWLDTTAGLHLQRKFVARTFNRALAAAGHSVRWTAKSRRDRNESGPGNNKKGPERTRAERDAYDAAEARRQSRADLFEVTGLLRDLTKLDRAASVIEENVTPLQTYASEAVKQLRQLASRCDEAMKTLEGLAAPFDQAPRKSDGMERTIANRHAAATEKGDEPSKVPMGASPEAASSPAVTHPPVGGQKKRRVSSGRIPALVLADETALAAMSEEVPDRQAFGVLRKAIVTGQIAAQRVEHGRYLAVSRDKGSIAALKTVVTSESGRAYLRAVIDSLLPAPKELRGWAGCSLSYRELVDQPLLATEAERPVEQEGIPEQAEDTEISLDVLQKAMQRQMGR